MKLFSIVFFVFGLWSTAVEAKELFCKMSTMEAEVAGRPNCYARCLG